jgi:hypothetical protein
MNRNRQPLNTEFQPFETLSHGPQESTYSASRGEYKVTRTYETNLHILAESWIGTDGLVA